VSGSEEALSTCSLPGFAGGIASIASNLSLGFVSGLPYHPLGVFRIAGLLFGLQGGRASNLLGGFCGGSRGGLPSFQGRFGSLPLGDTGVASHTDRCACRAALDGGRTVGCGLC